MTLIALTPAACGTDDFADRTAVVDVDGHRSTYRIGETDCGLDGDTVFLLGRADGGAVLQAVVGADPDDPTTARPGSSGLTVSDGPTDLAAFGPDAWARRGGDGDPPGEITDVSIRGARVQLEATAITLAADGTRPDTEARTIRLDARCSALDDHPTETAGRP